MQPLPFLLPKLSERAKRNTRLGLELRMDTIEIKIAEINDEIKLYQAYLRFDEMPNKKWIRHVIATLKKKLTKRKLQLARYNRRYTRLKAEGKI